MSSQPKRFSDFCQEAKPLDGAKTKIEDALNREILITGFKITHSKYNDNGHGKCLTLQYEVDGGRNVMFTGSTVLIDQIEKYGDEIPFVTTVRKIDRYYTLS